eukprot:1483648-Lingulodinium_polyedra.AAC.1
MAVAERAAGQEAEARAELSRLQATVGSCRQMINFWERKEEEEEEMWRRDEEWCLSQQHGCGEGGHLIPDDPRELTPDPGAAVLRAAAS